MDSLVAVAHPFACRLRSLDSAPVLQNLSRPRRLQLRLRLLPPSLSVVFEATVIWRVTSDIALYLALVAHYFTVRELDPPMRSAPPSLLAHSTRPLADSTSVAATSRRKHGRTL